MNPIDDCWKAIRDAIQADAGTMALIDGVHDKVPVNAFQARKAYLCRGPVDVVDDSAECIDGMEITYQIDVWSQSPTRAVCNSIVMRLRTLLHESQLDLTTHALVNLRVVLIRVFDDPDPTQTHGVLQVTAQIEASEE